MKSIRLLMLLCLLPLGVAFSQENSKIIYANNPDSAIVFENNNKITISTIDFTTDREIVRRGIYSMSMKHGIPFINVTWENNVIETFLMLSNNFVCYLYKASDPSPHVLGFAGSYNRGEFVFSTPKNIKASSSHVEKGRPYSPDQINQKLGQAWVEGARDQGIHEKLFINAPYLTSQQGCTLLHISIGFVSYEKPHLYEENSRPKKLNVSVANKFSFIVDLVDTPNFQTINLPQVLGINDILVIEILDVYPGTKYEDTCINSILYDTMPIGSTK